MTITLNDLRHFAVARNFFKPTTLKRALDRLGFVQADPIRAPARAQDLILRHRVSNYRAGDLERHYQSVGVQEDFFVNYGYVTRPLQKLMHPRSNSRVPADDVGRVWTGPNRTRAKLLLQFVRERGVVHPREVDEYFAHGKVKNYWGGSSNATTHLLDAMHYQGLLKVVRREKGIRVYSVHNHEPVQLNSIQRQMRIDSLADVVVNIYAPLTSTGLSFYLRRLRYAVPQWKNELGNALQRAKQRLSHTRVDNVDWYWPENDELTKDANFNSDTVRLLAPFDPLVHDRARFELLWGWTYRFEAYTPALKRKLGYYAMPLLWRDEVIGWANLSVQDGQLKSEFGYVGSQPRERSFKRELEAELSRMRLFLGVGR